jgi:hypothetical protein
MADQLRKPESGRRRRAVTRRAVMSLAGATASALAIGFGPSAAGATVPHSGCSASVGGNSGWCDLYPGNATANTKEFGQVTVSSGSTILVQTENASNGAAPLTSFVCLVSTPAAQITHRLQDTQCTKAGGVWLPFSGGSLVIDLSQFPQFLNSQFTIQVAANEHANDANGDASYNSVSVSTVTTCPVT